MKELTRATFQELKKEASIKTDYALAKSLNSTQSSISRYSNGSISISLEKLELIAKALNLKVIIKFEKNI